MSPAVAALIVVVSWELFRASTKRMVDRRVLLIAALSAMAFWFDMPSPIVLVSAGVLGVVLFRRRSL